MARLSLDDSAVERLKAYSQQYGTDDLANIIFALCSERDALMLCLTHATAATDKREAIASTTQQAATVAVDGLDDFSGLLDD